MDKDKQGPDRRTVLLGMGAAAIAGVDEAQAALHQDTGKEGKRSVEDAEDVEKDLQHLLRDIKETHGIDVRFGGSDADTVMSSDQKLDLLEKRDIALTIAVTLDTYPPGLLRRKNILHTILVAKMLTFANKKGPSGELILGQAHIQEGMMTLTASGDILADEETIHHEVFHFLDMVPDSVRVVDWYDRTRVNEEFIDGSILPQRAWFERDREWVALHANVTISPYREVRGEQDETYVEHPYLFFDHLVGIAGERPYAARNPSEDRAVSASILLTPYLHAVLLDKIEGETRQAVKSILEGKYRRIKELLYIRSDGEMDEKYWARIIAKGRDVRDRIIAAGKDSRSYYYEHYIEAKPPSPARKEDAHKD